MTRKLTICLLVLFAGGIVHSSHAAEDEYAAAVSARQTSIATFVAGLASVLDVFDTEEQFAIATIAIASAIADYNSAQLNMRAARGNLSLKDIYSGGD